jgi:hypothetical protein
MEYHYDSQKYPAPKELFKKKNSKTIKSYIFIKDTRLSNGNDLFFIFQNHMLSKMFLRT